MPVTVSAPPRRVEVLAYIIERIERSGTSPSYGEIARALKPAICKTRVTELVDQLVARDLIERPSSSRRGIRIRDLYRCRQVIADALGQQGWSKAQPLGGLEPPPCTFEHLPLIPLILHNREVH